MKRLGLLLVLVSSAAPISAQSPAWLEPYRPVAQRIITESQSNDFTWRRLAELTDTFGNRISGSETLEQAIDWAVATMKADGFENVHKEGVMVPKWVRGAESLDLITPVKQRLVMLGLGNAVGTPAGGIEADVIVVKNFDEMTKRAAEVKGKIVLFNADWVNYGVTNQYRTAGPSRAAALGAVAVLVRSVGPTGLRTPHTGGTIYAADQPKIPAAAIPDEDAGRLQRLQDRGVKIRV
jgi:carboxypeptidase Q